ncbi:MAG: patatin-like phospholipase family protein [Nitrospirae bacterium]|nr:MAG: patatin-like phospholipase family protein [Nitrospirota bacterium]
MRRPPMATDVPGDPTSRGPLLVRGCVSAALAVAIALAGCSWLGSGGPYGPIGESAGTFPLTRQDPFPFVVATPRPLSIGLACSGGGSRAAYLTAAILREIQRAELTLPPAGKGDHPSDLLSQIDFVSAVSGGALSAAYFVAHRDELLARPQAQPWDEYLDRMRLNYRRRQWYFQGLLNPLSWGRTLFTDFNRGNLAREDYDDHLYDGRTLGELPQRPVLYLNAFDVGNRVRFVFSRHFIDTGYYQPKMWTNQLNAPQAITSENDLVFARVDPGGVKIADAVYASSAFPFIYPNLAVHHFGNKIAFQGQRLFLADGGLSDNSGLLTLLTQMKIEIEQTPSTNLALAIYIDASIDAMGTGTKFQLQGIEETYASRDTYLGQGRNSVDAAIDHHEDAVFQFLESSGVIFDDLIPNYRLRLTVPPSGAPDPRTSWQDLMLSGQLRVRPLIIGLRLRHVHDAYYTIWARYKDRSDPGKARLLELFRQSGIPSGLEEGQETWPAETYRQLQRRISEIKTDFALDEDAQHTLDLVAYLLVHGKLVPALAEWQAAASSAAAR